MQGQVSSHQSCWTQATECSAQCANQENSHHSSARSLCLFLPLKNSPARWSMKLDNFFFFFLNRNQFKTEKGASIQKCLMNPNSAHVWNSRRIPKEPGTHPLSFHNPNFHGDELWTEMVWAWILHSAPTTASASEVQPHTAGTDWIVRQIPLLFENFLLITH